MRAYKRLISAIAVLLFMSGCAAGPNATTKMQGPSGSGDYARIGEIYIQNVVIVKGEENIGTVVATIINDSIEDFDCVRHREIYEANVLIRKALELESSDHHIQLAKEIKQQMGAKSLAKAQQYFEKGKAEDAYDEAKKALHLLGESQEAQNILDTIDQKNQRSKSKGKSLWILIVVVFLAGIVSMIAYYQSFSEEQSAWSKAHTEASIPSYQHFLEKFPKGKYASMAREALKTLYDKDEDLWNSAVNPPDKSNLGRYLLAMETAGGMHIEEAKMMIDSFDFDLALRAGSLEALQGYIGAHPNGVYIKSAKNLLTTLITPEEKTALFAYLQDFYEMFASGNHKALLMYFDEIERAWMLLERPFSTDPRFVTLINTDVH